MMHKLVLVGFLLVTSIQSTLNADSLIRAISSSNVNQVKNLLAQREAHEPIDSGYKKILSHVAQEACVMAKHNLKFLRSKRDIAQVVAGPVFIVGSIPLYVSTTALDNIIALPLSLAGMVCIYRGVRCKSAHARDNAAREIQLLIEEIP